MDLHYLVNLSLLLKKAFQKVFSFLHPFFKLPIKKLMKVKDPLNIEDWYPKIKDFTFSTVILDLTPEEADSIISFKEKKMNKDKQKILDRFEEKLEKNIDKKNGAFIKFSSRSPKDAIKHLKEKFESSLQDLLQKFPDNRNLCIVHAYHQALRVYNGREAMELLLNSTRIYNDLKQLVLESDSKNPFECKVAIRKWFDIYPGFEFRGFVYKKKLNALSQYFETVFLQELVNTKTIVEQKMLNIFDRIVRILKNNILEKCIRG